MERREVDQPVIREGPPLAGEDAHPGKKRTIENIGFTLGDKIFVVNLQPVVHGHRGKEEAVFTIEKGNRQKRMLVGLGPAELVAAESRGIDERVGRLDPSPGKARENYLLRVREGEIETIRGIEENLVIDVVGHAIHHFFLKTSFPEAEDLVVGSRGRAGRGIEFLAAFEAAGYFLMEGPGKAFGLPANRGSERAGRGPARGKRQG